MWLLMLSESDEDHTVLGVYSANHYPYARAIVAFLNEGYGPEDPIVFHLAGPYELR